MLTAFNNTHRGLRARYVPNTVVTATGIQGRGNPRVSAAVVGGDGNGLDLSAQFQASNMDPSVLLPGLLQTGHDLRGRLVGIPVDFSVYSVVYTRLTAAHIAVPSPSWSTEEFAAFSADVAQHGGRFQGAIARGGIGSSLPWLGYAEGCGGQVLIAGKLSLTSAKVLRGLNALSDLLRITWNLLFVRGTGPVVEFSAVNRTSPHPRTAAVSSGVVRFPRPPVPVVPAIAGLATVPRTAPRSEAGMTFVIWLISRAGQTALTSIGFPGVRTDMATPSWLTKGPAAVQPGDLRFSPPQLQALNGMNFGQRLTGVLLLPSNARPSALQKLEAVANSVIAGDLNVFAAGAQLNRAGIPVV